MYPLYNNTPALSLVTQQSPAVTSHICSALPHTYDVT